MSGPPPLRVTFEHANDGTRESGAARELSLGGVFVETARMLPVGAFVSLEIESGMSKAAIDGRVLSCRETAEGPDQPQGFSVRFIDLPNDVASTLHFMISTRMPRKGTTLGLGEPEEGVEQYESARSLPAAEGVGIRPASSMRIPIEEQAVEDAPRPAPPAAAPPAAAPPRAAPAAASAAAPRIASASASEPPRLAPSRAPLYIVVAAIVVVVVCVVVLFAR